MGHLKNRLNRIENKLHPSGEPVIITGSSTEELEKKEKEYLESGGNPHATLIRIVATKIDKCPEARN